MPDVAEFFRKMDQGYPFHHAELIGGSTLRRMAGATDIYTPATDEQIAASVEFLKYITSEEFISGLMAVTNSTYAITVEPSSDRLYIYNEVDEVMANTNGLVVELQNFDSEASGLTIVRNALQSIVQGATPDEIAATILDGYADIE